MDGGEVKSSVEEVVSFRTAMFRGWKPWLVEFRIPETFCLLCEDGEIWMSTRPCELLQTDVEVRKLYGRVLNGRLGLGVSLEHRAANPKVIHVVMVERIKCSSRAVGDAFCIAARGLAVRSQTVLQCGII
jgi:hypothetical protein